MAKNKKPKLVMPLAGIEERIISMQDRVRWILHVHRVSSKSRQWWSAKSNRSWL